MEAGGEPSKTAGFEDFRKTQGILAAQRERSSNNGQEQIKHLASLVVKLDELNTKIPQIHPEVLAGGGDGPWDSSLA